VASLADAGFIPCHEVAARLGLKAVAGIPIIIKGQVYGAFTLYSQFENNFDAAALQRLSVIVGRISVALEMSLAQEQLHLLGTALASAGNGIFITDEKGHIQWANASFTRITGYTSEEVLGQGPALLKSGQHDAAYYQSLWQTIQQGQVWSSETVERHKDGSLFSVHQTITPIRNEEGEVSHFVSILDDITAQKAAAERIQYMAHFDALTDLPNRVLFHDRLCQVLAQAKRDDYQCALIFLDLDRFKEVNDSFGHHGGDLLLQAVSSRLKTCVREIDTISRLAGDEFTVLLPRVSESRNATLVAEKIIASLSEPFQLDGHEAHIGCSAGIAFYPGDADTDEELLKCADAAMYAAKEKGRGQFCLYRQING
jgi:diguanylate cyclase (GGDEF)-like protein/PAS domain S-box-containing protein